MIDAKQGGAQDGTKGGWAWRLLRCGEFRLDGGAMFGMVPRVVWSRFCPTDDRNRISLNCNALLLERGGRRVLVETGIGDKFGAKERDIYAMEDRSILDALNEADCRPEDLDAVVVTHLHFDHAGGVTRRPRQGEGDDAVLAFPNAEIIVQRREWEDALANRSTMTKTYLRDHLTPQVAERVRLIDGAPADPEGPAGEGSFTFTEALPGIDVFRVAGHTWGQQAVRIRTVDGGTLIFVPDVMPTIHHAPATYNLAYDVEAWVSGQLRVRLLDAALQNGWTLALDHEPGPPIVRVEPDPSRPGAHRLVPADA